jgi:hypothetical protein
MTADYPAALISSLSMKKGREIVRKELVTGGG